MMVTSANALNEPTHAHNKFNTQIAAQHSLPSHGLFIELLLFVRCGVVNHSEMTVNVRRDVMKSDGTSASKGDRFIAYDLRNKAGNQRPPNSNAA